MNYFRTLSTFLRQRHVNPWLAMLRHSAWQVRKLVNAFPYEIQLDQAKFRVTNRAVANGCGALLNALGYYDFNNMAFLRSIFAGGDAAVFFDVGANIGVYSILVGAQSPRARVFGFEPHPATLELFRENVMLNGLQERIEVLGVALGDRHAWLRLEDRPAHPENHIVDDTDTASGWISVESQRGDTLCASLGMLPDVIKIDVEGFELPVLRGFAGVLGRTAAILVETADPDLTSGLIFDRGTFSGPYKLDYDARWFVSRNIHDEDWIYIHRGRLASLGDWKFDE